MLKAIRENLNKKMAQYNHYRQQVLDNLEACEQAEHQITITTEAQAIIQEVAQVTQEAAHGRITQIISRCLSAIFDEPYEFKMEFDKKRGKTEAQPKFYRNGNEIDPRDGMGCGVLDIAAFAARLSEIILSKPHKRKIMILDEPFKFVSRDYDARIAAMLEFLAKDFGMQFIIVTHNTGLMVGKVVELD